ncbi:MAG: carboxypeptidase-like regulatory domain-containing protein [Verrucomicrobia bacterium]|nr:carboxypeptidase-like regulatory domain-containing protein [Verrucomicrobiota bacterium]
MKTTRSSSILGFLSLVLALCAPPPATFAWGPHGEITRAAQEVLPEREKAAAYFGSEWRRLQDYSVMPDWRNSVRDDFFPNDFLLWPSVPTHIQHMMPEVAATYTPYFRRALQALRTETPPNAARWIGSLIHYVEDSGAPCHAKPIKGEMHKRLENWLDGKAVSIAGYQPRLLGNDDASALRGLLDRMKRLVAFSKQRAENIYAKVEALQQREDQPVILDCADESARAVADVLHTLFTLALTPPLPPSLAGHVTWPANVPLPKQPAKVMFLGTGYSTLTDTNGAWSFQKLPAKNPRVAIERYGAGTAIVKAADCASVTLPPTDPPGNLVRNGDLKLRWLAANTPDFWAAIPASQKLKGWESDSIRVRSNVVYRVGVADPQPGVRYGVRWRSSTSSAKTVSTNIVWSADIAERELPATSYAATAQLLVLTDKPLTNAVRRVWLVPSQ